jgi:hypothetical protein
MSYSLKTLQFFEQKATNVRAHKTFFFLLPLPEIIRFKGNRERFELQQSSTGKSYESQKI